MSFSPKNTIYSLLFFSSLFLVFLQGQSLRAFLINDRDADTYIAEEFGGNDCVDSLQSQYISTTPACQLSAPPIFLESRTDPDSDDDIADHAWMQDESNLYHLFFQNEDQGAGDYIEHYVSADLQSLTYVGPALQQNPAGWDSYGLWAPHIIKNPADGLYYMFYAGVTASGSNPAAYQRIGLARSSDLNTWTRYPINNCAGSSGEGCVYDCSEIWTRWGLGGDYDNQCRDPFVIWDNDNNRWLMFVTSLANVGGPWSQFVAVAESPDLINWSGLGYIKNSKRLFDFEGGVGAQLYGGKAENPFVAVYADNYYLFFTDYSDPEDYYTVPNPRTQIQYISSADLNVDSAGSLNWVYRGYIPDPGVNAPEVVVPHGDTWIMSQSVTNVNSGDWWLHGRDLRLKRMIWNEDGTFTTSRLTNLSCRVASADINPGQREICGDGLDNDCNGQVDYALEVCDGRDNDCDGLVDENRVCPRPRKIRWELCEEPDDSGGGACYVYY